MEMAKSGQCISQKRQPIQSSEAFITGLLSDPRSKTFLGQNAIQIPQALHQSKNITWLYNLFCFFGLTANIPKIILKLNGYIIYDHKS